MPENEPPKPLELPELIRTLKWIILTSPRNLTEWFVWGCMSIFVLGASVAMMDGIYGAYKHSRHIRHEGFSTLDGCCNSVKLAVESPSFWYDPVTESFPKHPLPNPLDNPLDMIVATYTEPSFVVINMPAGSSSGSYSYTAPVELWYTNSDGVIKTTKKPLT